MDIASFPGLREAMTFTDDKDEGNLPRIAWKKYQVTGLINRKRSGQWPIVTSARNKKTTTSNKYPSGKFGHTPGQNLLETHQPFGAVL